MDDDRRAALREAIDRAAGAAYLAADEAGVALDFLNNLMRPSGKDVQARAAGATWYRRKAERTGDVALFRGPGIPQGDQLRRTREATERAIVEIQATLALAVPDEAFATWDKLVRAHDDIDFIGSLQALSITPFHAKVNAADVSMAINAMNGSIAEMTRARTALGLLRLRLDSAD